MTAIGGAEDKGLEGERSQLKVLEIEDCSELI